MTDHPDDRPSHAPLVAPPALRRREFLGALAGLGAGIAASSPTRALATTDRIRAGDPFTLGVASGDPLHNAVVLWTRLAPRPFDPDGGMDPASVPVEWEVARDPTMRHRIRRGRVRAVQARAHTVHVDVRGLAPGREYWYRFRVDGHESPIGRMRTLPAPGATPRSFRLGVGSCQNWPSGFFTPLGHAADEHYDLFMHLGDYVYEYGIPATTPRGPDTPAPARPAPYTLEEWRYRYALYKQDPDLQAAHASCPWITTWDDHEVKNDYAGTIHATGSIAELRANAYRAWLEHQPVRAAMLGGDGGVRIHREVDLGRLARIDLLDGRQYRDRPTCSWGEGPQCEDYFDPTVSMLGADQEVWLISSLASSQARWNVLGNNVLFSRLNHEPVNGERLWHDAWDGFPANRQRIIDTWVSAGVRNPITILGDWHSTFVNDVLADFEDPSSPVVGSEIGGMALCQSTQYQAYYGPMIPFNPHIKYFDGDTRGHLRVTIEADEFRADLRMAPTVTTRGAPAFTMGSWVVEDGRPGFLPA